MLLFSVFDVKASSYSAPMAFPTVGMAARSFADEVARPDSNFSRHPEDYDMRQVGELNEQTGELLPCSPKVVTKASDHVQPK